MFETVEAFHRPASVREALQLLQKGKGRARIVAGGTDLAVQGGRDIRVLIDISRAGLTYIRKQAGSLAIGAATPLSELEDSPAIQALAGGLLAQAAATCGSIQIRNMATIGGNLMNGSAAADVATALLALDATVVVASGNSRRQTPIGEFMATPRKSKAPAALLVEFVIPTPPKSARSGWTFQKLGRTAMDMALVNVAAGLQLDSRGKVKWARLALGAVGPTPLRASQAEQRMAGRVLDQALLDEAGDLVAAAVSPITDRRATAEYRRAMSRVLAMRAIAQCGAQAGCQL
jgi:probable selenate reductase FAD-binding subunit